jgi:predicted metal-dependent HD superfamily phosphohydrolase
MPEAVLQTEWNRIIVPHIDPSKRELGELVLAQTIADYNSAGRHYHNLAHIINGHEQLTPYEGRPDFVQLWLAYLWHDVDYTIGPKNIHRMSDEKESAKKAYGHMEVLGLPGAYAVGRLIVATEKHDSDYEPEALMNAIDMSITAAPEPIYEVYRLGIREEYSWVPDDLYYPARARVLKSFARPIFRHPDYVHLEPIAQQNILAELSSIEQLCRKG